jgi:hypothetical protein
MNACIIECIFGKRFTTVYPAIKNYDSFFFTNNPGMKASIETAGWHYIFVDFPLSDDDAVSSFQSKYIKFLQFLKGDKYSLIKNYDAIIYMDHKLVLKDNHIKKLLEKINGYEILVKENPFPKNIWEEVAVAMFQERYLRFMLQTIDYVREKIQEGYSENPMMVLTGLIVYKHLDNKTTDFMDKVYKDLEKTGTSECQIIWSMLGQKYADIIKIVKSDDVDWEAPQTLITLIKRTLKLFLPYGLVESRWKSTR